MTQPDANALAAAALTALRQRRRWLCAMALTPFAVGGAVIAAAEVRAEELFVPILGFGGVVLLVELLGAISAGLAANEAARALLAALADAKEPGAGDDG